MIVTVKHKGDSVILSENDFNNLLQMMSEKGFDITARSLEASQQSVHWTAYTVLAIGLITLGIVIGSFLFGG